MGLEFRLVSSAPLQGLSAQDWNTQPPLIAVPPFYSPHWCTCFVFVQSCVLLLLLLLLVLCVAAGAADVGVFVRLVTPAVAPAVSRV